jgi:hypothetical protein
MKRVSHGKVGQIVLATMIAGKAASDFTLNAVLILTRYSSSFGPVFPSYLLNALMCLAVLTNNFMYVPAARFAAGVPNPTIVVFSVEVDCTL